MPLQSSIPFKGKRNLTVCNLVSSRSVEGAPSAAQSNALRSASLLYHTPPLQAPPGAFHSSSLLTTMLIYTRLAVFAAVLCNAAGQGEVPSPHFHPLLADTLADANTTETWCRDASECWAFQDTAAQCSNGVCECSGVADTSALCSMTGAFTATDTRSFLIVFTLPSVRCSVWRQEISREAALITGLKSAGPTVSDVTLFCASLVVIVEAESEAGDVETSIGLLKTAMQELQAADSSLASSSLETSVSMTGAQCEQIGAERTVLAEGYCFPFCAAGYERTETTSQGRFSCTATETATTSSSSSFDFSDWQVVLIVVLGCVTIIVIIVLVVYCLRNKGHTGAPLDEKEEPEEGQDRSIGVEENHFAYEMARYGTPVHESEDPPTRKAFPNLDVDVIV